MPVSSPDVTLAQRDHVARVGMWTFLVSEMLLFSGLFTLYAAYRATYGHEFALAGRHNLGWDGGLNTFILVTSSFTVAAALGSIEVGKRRRSMGLLVVTMLLGFAFLALKFYEYSVHFSEGIFPGVYYHFAKDPSPGAHMFFTLYYFMTGLHALHMTAGIVVLVWILQRVARGRFTAERHLGFELGVLYWHLVDLIWVFLWPLFYRSAG